MANVNAAVVDLGVLNVETAAIDCGAVGEDSVVFVPADLDWSLEKFKIKFIKNCVLVFFLKNTHIIDDIITVAVEFSGFTDFNDLDLWCVDLDGDCWRSSDGSLGCWFNCA